jgi:hypothetical protein
MQSSNSVSDRVPEFLGCLHGSLCLVLFGNQSHWPLREFFFNIVQALPAACSSYGS